MSAFDPLQTSLLTRMMLTRRGDAVFRMLKLLPPHGWRAVWRELGIVTLGVLIALAAQQVVETLHERRVADQTRAAIRAEFNDNLTNLALRGQATPCIARRLGELRRIMIAWAKTGQFETPQWVAQAPQLDFALPRYEAAVSAGRLALLPSAEQYRLGAIAEGFVEFARIQRDERSVWGRLRALQMGADALSPTDRTIILQALQDAATLDYEARIAVRQQLPFAKDAGYEPDFSEFRRTISRAWTGGRFTPSICTAIDTPPDKANRAQITPLP
jgi:hypothetical protein